MWGPSFDVAINLIWVFVFMPVALKLLWEMGK
jgi:hypothetical protein